MITRSGFIASMFLAVSRRVSPLTTLDVEAAMDKLSADSTRSATSKDERVRVELS